MNIYVEQIDSIAERFPDRPYMETLDGQVTTFGEFHVQVMEWAARLHRWGIDQGDRVAMVIDNRPEFVITWYACQAIGAIAVPLNPGLTEDSHRYLLELSAPRVCVFALARDPHRVRSALAAAGIPVWDLEPNDGISIGEPREVRDSPPAVADVPLDSPSQIIFTSGTTGRPKGAIQTPRLVRGLGALARRIGLTPDDRLLVASPMFHGLGQSWYQYSLTIGSRVVIAPRLSVSRFWDDARRHGVTAMQHVGATLSFLLSRPPDERDRDHAIRFTFGIGAPAPVWRAFTERFGIEIVEFYGMTEIGMAMFNDRPARPGSVGPLSGGVDIRLVDENGEDVPVGETGELWIRPTGDDGKYPEYYGEPEVTAEAIADGWFHTGDQLWRDQDGYFYFAGRRSDSLRQRGENIVPEDLERAVLRLNEIADAAAVGLPSRHGDMDIKLSLVLAPDAARNGDLRAVADAIRGVLPRVMQPRYLEPHETLPYTATNKVQRAILRRGNRRLWDMETDEWVAGDDVATAATAATRA